MRQKEDNILCGSLRIISLIISIRIIRIVLKRFYSYKKDILILIQKVLKDIVLTLLINFIVLNSNTNIRVNKQPRTRQPHDKTPFTNNQITIFLATSITELHERFSNNKKTLLCIIVNLRVFHSVFKRSVKSFKTTRNTTDIRAYVFLSVRNSTVQIMLSFKILSRNEHNRKIVCCHKYFQ